MCIGENDTELGFIRLIEAGLSAKDKELRERVEDAVGGAVQGSREAGEDGTVNEDGRAIWVEDSAREIPDEPASPGADAAA